MVFNDDDPQLLQSCVNENVGPWLRRVALRATLGWIPPALQAGKPRKSARGVARRL